MCVAGAVRSNVPTPPRRARSWSGGELRQERPKVVQLISDPLGGGAEDSSHFSPPVWSVGLKRLSVQGSTPPI